MFVCSRENQAQALRGSFAFDFVFAWSNFVRVILLGDSAHTTCETEHAGTVKGCLAAAGGPKGQERVHLRQKMRSASEATGGGWCWNKTQL